MFPGEDQLQEGIAAFQSGDRAKAHDLLMEVVKIDPENEQAWYYLAASEGNPTLRKQYLEQVLEINPSNAKAREVLDRIKAREVEDAQDMPASPPLAASTGTGKSRIRPLDPTVDTPGAATDEAGSFKIPIKIAGAPERVTWEALARDSVAMMRIGIDVIARKPGAYADEVPRATWWRFWFIAGAAAVGSGILSLFNALFLQVRYANSLFNIIAVLLTPFFFVAIALLTLFIGCYASYRWALTKGGRGSLLSHAYTVVLVWAPITLINSIISFVFNLFGSGAWIVTLVLSIYSILLIAEGFQNLHGFVEPNQKWITAIVMIAAEVVVTILLGVIFGGLIVSRALPFAF